MTNESRDNRKKEGYKTKTWVLGPRALKGLNALIQRTTAELGASVSETAAVNMLLSKQDSETN